MSQNTEVQKTNIEQKKALIQKGERYEFLDNLKIIAMLFVIYYHSYGDSVFNNIVSEVVRCFLSMCIPIFFMVNGALLLNKEFDLNKHVKKILKVFLITLLWSFVILNVTVLMKGYENLSFINYIYAVMITVQGYNSYLWFMFELLTIYLIFPLIKYLFDNTKKYFCFFCVLSLFFAFSESIFDTFTIISNNLFGKGNVVTKLIGIIVKFIDKFNITTRNFPVALSVFMLGGILFYYLVNFKDRIFTKKIKILLTIISFIGICLGCISSFWYNCALNTIDIWEGYDSFYTLLMIVSLFVFLFINNRKKQSKITKELTNNFFGIYMMHIIVNLILEFFLLPIKEICFITNFIFSFLFSYLFLKIKFIKNIFKI